MPLPDLSTKLRLRRPLVILLASIGLMAIAVYDTQRAVLSQRQVAEKALREYSSFAAWSYGQRLTEKLLQSQREVLGAVNHGDNTHSSHRIPAARELAHYLPFDERCNCHRARVGPNPDTFFAMQLGKDSLDVAINAHPNAAEGWEVDRPLPTSLPVTTPGDYSKVDRRWIIDTLTKRIRNMPDPENGFTLIVGSPDNKVGIIAYTVMATSWGDTMVYGARYSHTAFAQSLGRVLDGGGLLPASFFAGRRIRDVLVMRVSYDNDKQLFNSAPEAGRASVESGLGSRLTLSSRVGLMTVEATLRPELAGSLVIGGLPRSHLPFLILLLALAATMSIIAVVQLRREGELSRLRTDFVANVSHELRTPLAQIRLYTETLRLGRAKTEEQRDWSLGHIERETTRLSHLVENTLRFSRLGQAAGAPADPVDVGAEVLRIVDEFRPLATARQATIEVEIAQSATLALRGDALRHMLLNLLDNAVKYGPAGQRIRVTVATVGGELRLAVSDEGPGVKPSEREQIWRAFRRGEAARGKGGGGIGLTIVSEVAEQHGGRAWVESVTDSSTGHGARFIIALPLAEVAVAG